MSSQAVSTSTIGNIQAMAEVFANALDVYDEYEVEVAVKWADSDQLATIRRTEDEVVVDFH